MLHMRDTHEDFDILKLQIYKSNIDMSISYLFIQIQKEQFKYPIFDLHICNFMQNYIVKG